MGYSLVNILGGLLIVTSTMVVVSKTIQRPPLSGTRSSRLSWWACSLTLGASPPVRTELLMWAAIGLRHQGRSSFRYILNRAYKKMGSSLRDSIADLRPSSRPGPSCLTGRGGGHLLRGGHAA